MRSLYASSGPKAEGDGDQDPVASEKVYKSPS